METIVTTSPNSTPGTRLSSEMKNTFARALNALSACAWRTASDWVPKTRSGATETETNRSPISAALAPTLAVKNGCNSGVTIRAQVCALCARTLG